MRWRTSDDQICSSVLTNFLCFQLVGETEIIPESFTDMGIAIV